jgi:hypothetical protein
MRTLQQAARPSAEQLVANNILDFVGGFLDYY